MTAVARDSALHPARARFDALRRRIFGEMSQSAARWRLTWILPFNALVVLLLVASGQERWRSVVEVVVLCLSGALFVTQAYLAKNQKLSIVSLFVGTACYQTAVAVTGGLASPMLVSGVPMLAAAGVIMNDPKWMKSVYFLFFLSGFVVIAMLSHTKIGELSAPLTPVDGWPTAEYVAIAVASLAFAGVSTYRSGCVMSRAYEQIAFELAERREELCSETEDRTKALEGIAARLAHEVKNPLAAIKGLSTHMARSATDPKVAERLSIVAGEADRLQGIVDGFLSFSRGLDDLKVAPTKPYEIAREISLLLETRAADSGVALEVSGDPAIQLNADGRKLRQAILNLVLNAMQASPRGERVQLHLERGGPGILMKVIDHGAGMTSDVLDRIRKPYFTTKEGGSGLGVAVARGLIEQHGGKLDFESSPGHGTTATIALPVCSLRYMAKKLPNPCQKIAAALSGNAEAHADAKPVASEVPAEAPAR